jgi:PhnB protein
MTDDPNFAASARGVIPHLNVEGASEASAFYQRVFGAKELSRMPAEDGNRLVHCRLEINGGQIMLMDCFPEQGFDFQPSHSFNLTLVVEDGAEAVFKRAVDAGCQVVMPFQKMFWGDRWGQVIDPFQIRWSIDEPARER